MNEQDQIKALAEEDGWIYEPAGKDSFGVSYHPFWRHPHKPGIHHLPNYLYSYDVIIPLIQKQPEEVREQIAINLWGMLGIDSDWAEQEAWAYNFLTTPALFCEALLRATGKWKE